MKARVGWSAGSGGQAIAAAWQRVSPGQRDQLIDLGLVGSAVGLEIGFLSDSLGAPGSPPPAIPIALSVLAGLLLWFHRRSPLGVLLALLLIEGFLAAINAYPGGAPAVIALGLLSLQEERRRSVPALVVSAIVLQVGSISSLPVPVLAWAVGVYLQTRQRYVATLAERAEQLEREREQRDQLAAQAERTAIARELHDIVAHSVTVMLLGVRGARDSVRRDPDLAEEALRRVEKSGEESMAELRRMLLVLRNQGDGAALAPAPTLDQVPDLVARHREAGMPVTLSRTGSIRAAPPGIELTAYRIVQEGLTNVLRHAHSPSQVSVHIGYGDERLEVVVQDDGRVAPASAWEGGHGLRGLHERVSAAGGELATQSPVPPSIGGFRLTAQLPRPKDQTP
ncbi:two-component sensor histidine kinase [Kineosporia sp. NBRC 101677]|nr:two-component sensor histidine kinase [Kineosporia sp. NBRC 101677]